jgi:hypothetical protein
MINSAALSLRASICVIGLFSSTVATATDQCDVEMRYEHVALGNFGFPGSYASDVNEFGHVSGAASASEETGRAFVWNCARGMTNIGALSEDHYSSSAQFVNDLGQVVGQSFAEDTVEAFIWDRHNGMRSLGMVAPMSLNDRGDVTFNSSEGIVLWSEASGGVPLQTLANLQLREGFVNNRREVGGFGFYPDAPDDRFLVWSARRGVNLRGPEPSDGFMHYVRQMNDRSEMIGTAFAPHTAVPFIVRRDGTYQRLIDPVADRYVEAVGFNNRRQVIGFYFLAWQPQQPFLWDAKHGLRDLNMLVYGRMPETGEARVAGASAINEWGWIAGSVVPAGGTFHEAALFVPVPANEPYFRNLNRLRGGALCRAFTSLQVRAAASALLCKFKESSKD